MGSVLILGFSLFSLNLLLEVAWGRDNWFLC